MNLNIYMWGALITACSNLAISFFVYFKNRKGPINKIFPLFSLSIGLWAFCWFMENESPNSTIALFWAKALSVASIFIPAFFIHFIFVISDIVKNKRNILIGNYLLVLIFLYFCYFTDLFVKDVAPIFSFNYYIQPGLIYVVHLLSFIIMTIYGTFELVKATKISVGLKHNQLKYLFWALIIGYTGGITAFFPIYKIPMPPFAIYTIPVCIIVIAYTIVKYRLMDINVSITRTGVFIAVYTLVMGIPFILATSGKTRVTELFGENWWVALLVLMAALATAGPFLYIYLEKRAEAILFREQLRYQETLRQAAREMARIHNLRKLLNLIVHTVTRTVRIFHSAVYLFDKNKNQFILEASRNLKNIQPKTISEHNSLIIWLREHRESLVYEELKRRAQELRKPEFKELEAQMRSFNAAVIVPGFLEDRMLGFLTLGDKRSGKVYSTEDLNTFSLLANQAALAIENALLYENIEDQVRQRTKELVEVQKQLIQAEKLATVGTLAGGVAHEINNPLTAILTNAQMLLAATNTFDPDSRESLELIEEATKRCKDIVQKLMTYAKKPLDSAEISEVHLSSIIDKVISFLSYQLEQDNVKVVKEAREGQYLVKGNPNELEQVITNVILNAKDAIKKIKKSGNIYILLLDERDWIKIQIKDEGIGIPKEIIPKIFDPFFTTKDVGKGLGLGLSICQAIIEKHNGLIRVQSEPNKGSVFTITLPKIKIYHNAYL